MKWAYKCPWNFSKFALHTRTAQKGPTKFLVASSHVSRLGNHLKLLEIESSNSFSCLEILKKYFFGRCSLAQLHSLKADYHCNLIKDTQEGS